MRYVFGSVLALLLAAGCGSHETSDISTSTTTTSAETTADASATQPGAPQGEVTDEKIGMPLYAGCKEVEYTRVALHSDIGDTFSVSCITTDTPAQVATFYQAEGTKVGTLMESVTTGDLLRSVGVNRTDGTQSAIQARTDGKGKTVVSIHRFFPAKK